MIKPLPQNRAEAIREIIRRKVRSKPTPEHFEDLDDFQKGSVLEYIEDNGLDIHLFEKRGFDVLRQTFFVNEYASASRLSRREFGSFREYYDFLSGEIYDQASYFGYAFQDGEISKCDIDLGRINYGPFTAKRIDDPEYSFAYLETARSERLAECEKYANRVKIWLKKLKPITSMAAYEGAFRRFPQQSLYGDKEVFASFVLQKNKKEFKKTAVIAFVKDLVHGTLDFPRLALAYGKEYAAKVISALEQKGEEREAIRCKAFLEAGASGELMRARESGYDSTKALYYVDSTYRYSTFYWRVKDYFFTFAEMAEALGGDLSNCDLSLAPVKREEIDESFIAETTILPFLHEVSETKTIKRYDAKGFTVVLQFFDANGAKVHSKKEVFDFFADFVFFLNKDLSGADLISLDGLENLPPNQGINLLGARMRSGVAKSLGLAFEALEEGKYLPTSFEETSGHEVATVDAFLQKRGEDEDFNTTVRYLSDLHLLHRFEVNHCETEDDTIYVTRKIAEMLAESSDGISFLLGDISSDAFIYQRFIKSVFKLNNRTNYFVTLGNHELWPFKGKSLPQIVNGYRALLSEHGFKLLHNNIYFKKDYFFEEISQEELASMTVESLKEKLKYSKLTIFGGLAFAGLNENFNANQGIYRETLNREGEIEETRVFNGLYEKVVEACSGRNLIIATHMPIKDWCDNPRFESNFVYINGHSHRNYFCDDGIKRIFADNQIGYKGKNVFWKTFGINQGYDWFKEYPDGIHEITRDDYIAFYRGINEPVGFSRAFHKLFFLKRSGCYLFILQTEKGKLQILNGGAIKNALGHDLQYFYDNMVNYAESVKMFLDKYFRFQKAISKEVKDMGGDGHIHGSIVDIDFYNHLYINPLDGSVTPYFAIDMIDKTVYANVLSLLKCHAPALYEKATKSIGNGESHYALVPVGIKIDKRGVWEPSTSMYKVSRILKGLQYTINHNIIRLWSDNLAEKPTEEVGKEIVSGILAPALIDKKDVD